MVLPREGHPLKERLRHDVGSAVASIIRSQSGSSTKRGIKTLINFFSHGSVFPREGHPLKEGLRRHEQLLLGFTLGTPREGHPLKEGLRQTIS